MLTKSSENCRSFGQHFYLGPKEASLEHSGRMDWKTVHSTIDVSPGVLGVSKDAPGYTEFEFRGLVMDVSTSMV